MAGTQWDLINLLTPTSKEDPDPPCYDPSYLVYAIDNFGDSAEGSRRHRAITCGISTLLSMAEAIFGKNGPSWGDAALEGDLHSTNDDWPTDPDPGAVGPRRLYLILFVKERDRIFALATDYVLAARLAAVMLGRIS